MTSGIKSTKLSPSLDSVQVRPVRLDDLEEIDNFLQPVSFNTGVHILKLYFLNSERIWHVAENEKGEIVAFNSVHKLPLTNIRAVFGYDVYIRDDYQRLGIGREFNQATGNLTIIGNSTYQSMQQLSICDKFDTKLVGYAGTPDMNRLDDAFRSNQFASKNRVELLKSESDMIDLLNYDRTVLQLDRSKFVREWCSISEGDEPYGRTFIARGIGDGSVVGFVTARRFTDYHVIMPLYANDQSIAASLLIEMIRLFTDECPDESLYVYFDANNYFMMRLVHALKFEQCDSEMRQYGSGPIEVKNEIKKRIRFERVYAYHDYWPV